MRGFTLAISRNDFEVLCCALLRTKERIENDQVVFVESDFTEARNFVVDHLADLGMTLIGDDWLVEARISYPKDHMYDEAWVTRHLVVTFP